MSKFIDRRRALGLLGLGLAAGVAGVAAADAATKAHDTYSSDEILLEGQKFFGKTTRGLAEAVEYVFSNQGEPTAYIVGEEGSGAFVGGLRYGEGVIYYKNGPRYKIYWQGPSVGFDFGGGLLRRRELVLLGH